MKYIIAVDWLDKYGGAERVIRSLCNVFKFKKCYTLVNIMSKNDLHKTFNANDISINESPFIKPLQAKFRILLPLFSFAIRHFKIDKSVDVIISSSHAIAKGIKKSTPNQLHISYFQARNLKYIWDDAALYFGPFKFLFSPLIRYLQKQDFKDAQTPDYIVANSHFVKDWIKKNYNRDATVIYPPVDLSNFQLHTDKKDHYVAVGRLEPYKRFDIIIDAFNQTDKKLIIIGDGSQLKKLKKMASKNITFTGFLNSQNVHSYISQAKGFIHAGVEDFGIAPIEAQACGTPVIAYGYGGVLETVIPHKTGLFFYQKNSTSLLRTIAEFEKHTFDYFEIRQQSERFKEAVFLKNIRQFTAKKTKEHLKHLNN